MPWSTRGQYCAYCKSYLNSGNLSRHLETCARFDGRFSVDRAKDALELEQKHKAKYTTKYVLSRSEVYEIIGELSAIHLPIQWAKKCWRKLDIG